MSTVTPVSTPSPDRTHLILVMHLDKGWSVDGAVYPVVLPASVSEAFRSSRRDELLIRFERRVSPGSHSIP